MSEENQENLAEYEISARAPIWKRIVGNKMLMAGGILVTICLLLAFLGPVFTDQDPLKMNVRIRLAAPSAEHVMGTDQFGRDLFARVVYGARLSVSVAFMAVIIGVSCGLIIGSIAGYFGGLIDDILMRIMDAIMAFPGLILALGLAAFIGPSFWTLSVIIGILYIPSFSRMMRGSVMSESNKEYVEGARAIGQSRIKVLVSHVGPNCISPIFVLASMCFAAAMIIEAELSFLGVGVPPPTPSWGAMLFDSRDYLELSPYVSVFPGMMLTLGVLGFNLLGDGLRDFFDPKTYKGQ